MHKELSKDLSSIKKTQSETKDTLIEIQNNLQGNNSRVVKPRFKPLTDLDHKEGKKPIGTVRRKKNPKNQG